MLVLGALVATAASWSLRRRAAVARGPVPDEGKTLARLADTQRELDETRASLADARAEVLRMNGRAKTMNDRAEAEMGRMESAAIAALESAAASNRQDVAALRQKLAAAEDTAGVLRGELDAERRRSEQLQSALASRDTQLASLRANARGSDAHHA